MNKTQIFDIDSKESKELAEKYGGLQKLEMGLEKGHRNSRSNSGSSSDDPLEPYRPRKARPSHHGQAFKPKKKIELVGHRTVDIKNKGLGRARYGGLGGKRLPGEITQKNKSLN